MKEAVLDDGGVAPISVGVVFKFPNRKLRAYGGCLD